MVWSTIALDGDLHDIVADGQGGYLAVGADRRGGLIWTSTDGGVDWLVASDAEPLDHARLTLAAVGAGGRVAFGCLVVEGACTGTTVWADEPVATGKGGPAWTRVPTGTAFANATIADVAGRDGLVIAVGSDPGPAIWTSTDRRHWTRVAGIPANATAKIDSITAVGDRFIAGGTDDSKPVIWVTQDGQHWSSRAIAAQAGEVTSIAVFGTSVLAGGALVSATDATLRQAAIWRSVDGVAWPAEPVTLRGEGPVKLAIGPRGAVAWNGQQSTSWYTPDGLAWSTDSAYTGEQVVEGMVGTSIGFIGVGPRRIHVSPQQPIYPARSFAANTPAATTWETLSAMPLLAPGFTATAETNGRIFVFSDADGRGQLRVDIDTLYGTPQKPAGWRRAADVAAGLVAPHALTSPKGLMYLVGISPDQQHGAMIRYDTGTGKWRALPGPPTARRGAAIAFSPDGRLYVFGGQTAPCCTSAQGDGSLAVVERFDPKTSLWQRLGDMPAHALGLSAVSSNFDPAESGGTGAAGPRILVFLPERVWIYDPANDTWAAGPATSEYGISGSATVGEDGLVRVFGCTRYDLYDPVSSHWQAGQQLLTPRCNPAVVEIDAAIYVLGGDYSGSPGRVVESTFAGGG